MEGEEAMTEEQVRLGRAAALLNEAARLLDRALVDVDGSAAPCACCGINVAKFHRQWKVHTALAGRSGQLRNHARELMDARSERPNPAYEPALAAFHAAAQHHDDDNGDR